MKPGIQTSGNRPSQKNSKNFHVNYHLALQLYSLYKLESMPKKEPRLPLKDWRMPVIKKHRKFTLKPVSQFLNIDILSFKKAFGWFSSQLHFTYINFLNK
jgi:hypothetical protein